MFLKYQLLSETLTKILNEKKNHLPIDFHTVKNKFYTARQVKKSWLSKKEVKNSTKVLTSRYVTILPGYIFA